MSTTSIPLFQVDAFTSQPYRGNPAAICLLDAPRDPEWMQAVAAEMNLSETAFLVPGPDGFDLRWFTPAVEVAICGHATLASAHILWETGKVAATADEIRFHTKSGVLIARRHPDGIALDFPGYPTEPTELPDEVARAIAVTPVRVARVKDDRMGEPTVIVELATVEAVRTIAPDLAGLRHRGAPGVIVTTRADSAHPDHDFVSRCFFPAGGIDEDPVTGSAHCALAMYWEERVGRQEMVGYQASRRGGTVRVRVAGDRVHLIGTAVTVLRGSLVA